MTYTESFKSNAVAKLLAPGSPGLKATSRKLGVPSSTLFGWKEKYANNSIMKKIKNKSINKWSAEEKFEAVIKTASMSENEFGDYLRTNGLYSSDLEAFKKEIVALLPLKGRPKLDPEVVELRKANKELKKDLRRNESALAEQSARIILLKKSHEIWGVEEEEE